MATVHAVAQAGRLILWVESSDPPAHRRRRGKESPKVHPQALRVNEARALLGALPHLVGEAGDDLEAVLWLPTAGREGRTKPQPGDPLAPAASEPVVFKPWQVPGVGLEPVDALPLVRVAGDRSMLDTGVRLGREFAWLAALLKVSEAVVARQSLLPGLVLHPEPRSVWLPLWIDAEEQALLVLARTMPGIIRCLSEPPADPGRLTRVLAAAFADALVRRALPGGPSRPEPSANPDAAWMRALGRRDGRVDIPPEQAESLRERIEVWQRPVTQTAGARVRIQLRLEEPENPGAKWRLSYLLQAADDPSLLVPASDLWGGKRNRRDLIAARLPGAAEALLLTLGRVAPVFPPVERSLTRPKPTSAELSTPEAHRFLTETASLLAESGIGVMLPAAWVPGRSRLRLVAKASARTAATQAGSSGLSLDALAEVDYEVALGGSVLSEEELTQLAALKEPLVEIRGQWVEVRPDELKALFEIRTQRAAHRVSVREVLGLTLGREQASGPGGLEVESVEASGPLADLLDRLTGRAALPEEPVPDRFHGELRPYQERGYAWLAFLTDLGLGALLADDMGLGKTVQTLCLLVRQSKREPGRPMLLCCPTSLLGNWRREAERFTPDLEVVVHHGSDRLGDEAFSKSIAGRLVLTSYGVLSRERSLLSSVDWAAVVLDEAQVVKNHRTHAARAAQGLRAARRIALTGTPVENHAGDLWSIMQFLNPGMLGGETAFRERFILPVQADPGGEAAKRLSRLTRPFLLRRAKTDKTILADLPDKLEMKVTCTLTPEQASLYKAVVDRMEKAMKDPHSRIERQGLVLSTLTRLKQVCDHPALFLADGSALAGRSGKLDRLESMLAEVLAAGERALVFSQFAEMAGLLAKRLERVLGQEVLLLTGDTTRRERDRIVERFQTEEGGPPVLILTLGAGGTGLNLTRASHVFHFDRWWNPAVENQASDRAYRIGQTRTVEVHKFLCAGTLEEKIDAVLERKREVAEGVLGSGDGWLTALDPEALSDLIRLSLSEALAE